MSGGNWPGPAAPGHGVGATIESVLAAMSGDRLRYLGRATDLVWIGVGADVEAPDRHGRRRVLAEHALHLQCPWRLTRLGLPLLASWDVYRAVGSDERAEDELLPGEAAFDPVAQELTTAAEQSDQRVERLVANDWGGFVMEFTGGVMLEVLPVTTASEECWRYFRPGEDVDHFVVFDDPEQA